MYKSYINKIEDVGKLRNLKPGTIRTYQNNVKDFLKFINKHPDELTCEDARDFLLHLKNKGNKASTLNNKNGALVFFYKRILGKLWDDNLVPRAINDYAIPRVLSHSEVERLPDATPNLKYKAIFTLMYSAGLRISEVIHLNYDDISRTNMQIYIHETKTHTSRYALLSQRALDILTEYWFKCGRPQGILFPNAPYFHVVFTIPQELNPLIYSNQQLLYDALYHSISATINELTCDTKHLGAKVGYICVLHTWGSEMNFHPHIHVILLGGGLTSKKQWRDKGEEFFLPVKVISKLFRGKYMDELKLLWNGKKLQFHGNSEKYRNHYTFKELLNICYEKDWVPHCNKTFNGAQSVINYLGKYTHRIAISNYRIIRISEDTVTYYVKDYREKGKWKEFTISGIEFIRRFLMHVPPKEAVNFSVSLN